MKVLGDLPVIKDPEPQQQQPESRDRSLRDKGVHETSKGGRVEPKEKRPKDGSAMPLFRMSPHCSFYIWGPLDYHLKYLVTFKI